MPRAKKRQDGLYQKSVTINGKRHVFYGKSQSEITRKILNFEERERNGPTFKEVADEWYNDAEARLEYNSYSHYKTYSLRLVDEFGSSYISTINVVEVNRYIQRLAEMNFAKKTVKNILSVISQIMRFAIVRGYIDTNPCQYVSVPKHLRQSKRELPAEEDISKVKNSVNCDFGFFALFLLYTGLRKGEALALTYGDIDIKNSVIHVTKSVYFEGNIPKIKRPKTDAGYRDVLIPECLVSFFKTKHKPSDVVFPNNEGDYMHASYFRDKWNRYRAESGVGITPHQLRHAYATILYDAGLKDKDAQELLGHSDINVTKNIYTHISQSRKQATAALINKFIETQ